jgi:pimeloyl-ACP methyl ester carboxylesterase
MPTQTTDLFLPEDLEDGGAESWGEEAGNGMKPATAHVQTVAIPGAGHWVAEQAPDRMLAALNAFLAPYRDGG